MAAGGCGGSAAAVVRSAFITLNFQQNFSLFHSSSRSNQAVFSFS